MKIIKLLFAGFLVLFLHTKLLAQNDVDSVAAKLGDLTQTQSQSLGDTVESRKKLETDSTEDYKSDKDFAYMKYLDSLLRQTKDLSVDTFSVNSASSKSKKDVQQNPYPFYNLLWNLFQVFFGLQLYRPKIEIEFV